MQSNNINNNSQMTNNSSVSTVASTLRSYCFSRNPTLSEARRSFFLITVFDFAFMVLLWLIYCTTRGYSLKDAYENEIVNYNIDMSLFDVVILSLLRLLLLAIIYVFVRLVHWLPVAFVTFGSSTFLIAKVILFAMKGTHKVITDYVILIISFVIAWIQVWYLEIKIFAPERSPYVQLNDVERSHQSVEQRPNTLYERGYGSINRRAISDVGSFYSPLDSPNDSENENDNKRTTTNQQLPTSSQLLPDFTNLSINSQAKEYELLARECISKVLDIFNKKDGWKIEKEVNIQQQLSINDDNIDQKFNETRIYSQKFNKIGKVFKLESYIKYNDKIIIKVLRDDIDEYPLWNKAVKASKVLQRYSENLAILYSSVHEQVGGLVSPRDFVNLSSYAKVNDLHVLAGTACVHASMPPQEGYVRGENGQTAYIIKSIDKMTSHVTWLLNVNLNGWLPQYAIDQSLSNVQIQFITSLIEYLKGYS